MVCCDHDCRKSRLGLSGDDTVDIIDVKCDLEMTSMIIQTYGFLPGYHMNKQHWITILLDGSASKAKTMDVLDMSYDLIDGAGRKEKNEKSNRICISTSRPIV